MKLKKIITGLLLTAALFGLAACAKQKKAAEPVLNKTQVIKIAKKDFKSGQVKQVISFGTDTTKQIITSSAAFGGNPTVFHINYQTQSKGQTQTSEEWIDTNNIYFNGQSSWYKAGLETLTGHNYAQMIDAIMDNKMLADPPTALTKAYKMKRSRNTYTLTATIKDHGIMKQAIDPIFTTNNQSAKQEQSYRSIQKYGKYQDMPVKLVVKNGKLFSFTYTVNMSIDKTMTMSVSQTYNNFGSHDFLKVPNNALAAKPLPKSNNQNKK
ncbi:hypothetical protein PT285_01900 [Lactobacillus sp. ESL0791]|uniref:DUF6612 family protein n=1 Tax=Lactobacillus sp. ESL0791 TaxID=2983234 RepID=UPI0023F98F0A|nr:DUF6612 family protein [Lactobacillus sp. ESL0791]MDF7638190.1 hypothetical protein [Lactobacillus sp. ESL0791]